MGNFQDNTMITINCEGLTTSSTQDYIQEWYIRLQKTNLPDSSCIDLTVSTLLQEISNPSFAI